MADLNFQNLHGDTPLHVGLQGTKMGMDVLEFLLSNGTNLHIRNYKGRSVLHEAVKYSNLGIPAIDLLLKHGASVNAIDNEGSTILHDALKNPLVTLSTIKKLLEYGAHPDYRDDNNYPPLAYCELSSLQFAEKESAEKLLIKYTCLKKLDNNKLEQLESGRSLVEGDEILCLHFCKDVEKRNEWVAFRDSCLAEILSMARLSVGNINLLKLVTNHCYKRTKEAVSILLIKELSRLAHDEYPVFKDIIMSAIEVCDLNTQMTELNV